MKIRRTENVTEADWRLISDLNPGKAILTSIVKQDNGDIHVTLIHKARGNE